MKLSSSALLLMAAIASCGSPQEQSQTAADTLAQTQPAVWVAEIASEGYWDCFEPGLKDNKGKPVYCEASAVVCYDGKLILVSDKPIPGKSPFMTSEMSFLGQKPVGYLTQTAYTSVSKIEDLTLLPDESYVVATTAFDRYNPKERKSDSYNQLLFWPKNQESAVKSISFGNPEGFIADFRQKITSSVSVAQYPEITYFKIEGLAALPGSRLVFGIREAGKDYENFAYTIKLVATTLDTEKGILGSEFRQIYEFAPDTMRYKGLLGPLALSSIEFDRFNDRVLMLTSFEIGENIGAYLWTVSLADFEAQKAPDLVTLPEGKPLLFSHKAEGITVIDSATVLVVHDDDRILERNSVPVGATNFTHRKPHQNAYSVIKFSKK